MTDQPHGRGPDPLAIAMRAWADAVLAAKAEEQRLERIANDLRHAQALLAEHGVHRVEVEFGRTMTAALEVSAGIAFWDRQPIDPTPMALSEAER
jgi:hypothetical protein